MSAWEQAAELFEQALELPPEQRAELLDRLEREDASLCERVRKLLEHDQKPLTLLATGGAVVSLEDRLFATLSGSRIADFTLERMLAVGGMGAVYEAHQARPSRRVAVKIMRVGLSDAAARQRFRHEAEILARLDHPGIAKVYAAGIHVDPERYGPLEIPYFAMEFIEGAKPLLAHARLARLGLAERVRLAARICDAVQHGHQHGIVHRDLKSANVLVDHDGNPKLIDFGIARSMRGIPGATLLQTQTGELLGTPAAMSPEQLEGDPGAVDTRSDVYSLGVVFYELLCEQAPYELEGRSIPEVVRIVREAPPRTPPPSLPRELGWVLLRALEKEPGRRYATASELAADLRRWLDHEPLEAGPPSRVYRLRKLARKHRLLVASLVLVFSTLSVGAAAATWGLLEAKGANVELGKQRDAAERASGQAQTEAAKAVRVSGLFASIFASVNPDLDGRDVRVLDLLERTGRRIESELADEPDLLITFDATLGESFLALGAWEQAEKHLERARASSLALFGARSLQVLRVELFLSRLRFERGEIEAAGEHAQSALETATLLGNVIDRARAEVELGRVAQEQARFEEAERYYLEALPVLESDLASQPDWSVSVRAQIGTIYLEQRRGEEALAMLEPCLEWVRSNAPGTTLAASILNALSVAYSLLGREEEALALVEECLRIREESFGLDHEQTIAARHNWATSLMRHGDLDGARGEFEQVAEWRERRLGAHNQSTLATWNQLGVLEKRAGNTERAEEWMGRVAESAPAVYPPQNVNLGSFLANDCVLLCELGRLADARRRYRQAVEALEASGEAGATILASLRSSFGYLEEQ